ncbi:MAG: ATP-binding protein [Smithella sp.]
MKHKYMLLLLIVMLGLCFFLFNSFYNQAQQEAIKETNDKQLLYARQAARGIEDFFNNWTNTLTAMSELPSFINLDERGKENMEFLYRANRNMVRAITRVDETGKIIYTYPFDHNSIGKDISNQNHVREIIQTHKPVVSNVFSTVQGYDAVALHVPVFSNKIYKGTIGINVNFQELARRYLENIKIGNTGYAWMVSRDGTELFCPVPGHTGKSVFENCKNFPSILAMAKDMLKGNQGFTTYTFDKIRGREIETTKKHAVYVSIKIGNTFWSVVVASSEDEIIASLKGFRNKLIAIIGVLLLLGILFSYYGLKVFFMIREEKKRLRTEQALRDSEEKYRNIFENAIEGIFQTTPEGVYLSMNPAFAKMFGFASPREMIASITNIAEQLYVNSQKREDMLRRLREQNKVEGYELEVYRKDKSKFWIVINIHTVRDASGEILYFEGTNVDITQRKWAEEEKQRLEERLQRSEKMEALGTMAGGVAHDLNNVLGVVVGYAELLLMDINESSPVRPYLTNIIEGGQKAAAIVQDLLTLARRGVAGRTVLNLNKIITDSLQSPEFEKLHSFHPGVQIITDLEPDLLNISGSSVHLGKSFYNLVSNASEAMAQGGVLTIRTANQYLDKPIQGYDEVKEGDYVILTVSDTGQGIPDADLKHIFEPFYTKKVMGRSGTGLGLAVVWGTVKDHNGYINVQSEEGKESIFTLYLPVTRENIAAEDVPLSISEYMGRGETILVVDDVKGQRDLASDMLTKLHYNIIAVSSGEEAVAYLTDHVVDLMVLDMIMEPGMDGLDTYKKVSEIHPRQKAIIVSGFSESDRVHAVQALGAGAYVRKPYIIEKLGLAVRKELDKK